MSDRTKAAERLHALLAPKELTQASLAKTLGVTREAVRQWMSGETRPRGDMRERIAEELGIPTRDWLEPQEDVPAKCSCGKEPRQAGAQERGERSGGAEELDRDD